MTVLHTGSTEKFASGWESIFSQGKKKNAKAKVGGKSAGGSSRKSAKKKSAAKKK